MATPPDRDHRISLQQGIDYTTRFRAANPDATKAWMFWGKGGLTELMAQSKCAGIRIYNGADDKGVVTPVLVAVDAQGNDLTSGTLLELGMPCPIWCSEKSPLLGD